MVRNLVLFSVDRVINRHQGEQTMFLDILSWNGHFLGTFLVVLLPKNFHFSFTSHLIGFADLPIITTKKREILTDTRKRASREKAPVNVQSTSECDTSECVEPQTSEYQDNYEFYVIRQKSPVFLGPCCGQTNGPFLAFKGSN